MPATKPRNLTANRARNVLTKAGLLDAVTGELTFMHDDDVVPSIRIEGHEVEVIAVRNLQSEDGTSKASLDSDVTDDLREQVEEALGAAGYTLSWLCTGYGSWILDGRAQAPRAYRHD